MRQMKWALLAVLCVLGAAVQAHHSFPATYLVDEETMIEGTLAAFMYRNPHSFVHVVVKDKNGAEIRYAVEWGAAGALDRMGVARTTFRVGDHVKVWGNPGRNPEDHRLRLRRIERPSDGYRWGFDPNQNFD